MSINNISDQTKAEIKRKSAFSLPNRPSAEGMKADEIKKAFYTPIIDNAYSLIGEIDRVINEANKTFETFSTLANDNDFLGNVTFEKEVLFKLGLDANNQEIIRVKYPTRTDGVANKFYVDQAVEAGRLKDTSELNLKDDTELINFDNITTQHGANRQFATTLKGHITAINGNTANINSNLDAINKINNAIKDDLISVEYNSNTNSLEVGYRNETGGRISLIPRQINGIDTSIILNGGPSKHLNDENKVFLLGELIYEFDTNKIKIGDGTSAYKDLNYLNPDTIDVSKVIGLGTSATKDVGTSAGQVPVLDTNGKLDNSIIPSLALVDVFTVDTEAKMLALTAQQGDVAIRTDIHKTYILTNNDPTKIASWVELQVPGGVISVNGKIGTVTLATKDIAEDTNLYYTQARFDTAFKAKSSSDLADGATILHTTDTLVINGGGA